MPILSTLYPYLILFLPMAAWCPTNTIQYSLLHRPLLSTLHLPGPSLVILRLNHQKATKPTRHPTSPPPNLTLTFTPTNYSLTSPSPPTLQPLIHQLPLLPSTSLPGGFFSSIACKKGDHSLFSPTFTFPNLLASLSPSQDLPLDRGTQVTPRPGEAQCRRQVCRRRQKDTKENN